MSASLRKARLEIGQRGEQGKAWADLPFTFKVKHNDTEKPNQATIRITNIDQRDIEPLRNGAIIRVFCGYRAPKLLFSGTPAKDGGISEPDGQTDQVTKITAQDGGSELARAQLNLTFESTVSAERALRAVANQVGLPIGRLEIPEPATFRQGVTFTGQARGAIQRVADMTNAKWSYQDGRLVFYSRQRGKERRVTQFSRENGTLYGQVKVQNDGKQFRTRLDPAIRPDDYFSIGDTRHSGLYRAGTITFAGSSGWEQKHEAKIKATPVDP